MDISLNKAQVSPGVKVANICAASLIGINEEIGRASCRERV